MTSASRPTVVPANTPVAHRAALEAAMGLWRELLGDRLVSVVLFGSVARGAATPESDIDLLVVASGLPRSLAERRRPLLAAWERLRQEHGLTAVEWNLVVKTPEEAVHRSPLYLDIVEDGVLLVDRDGFFRQILDGLQSRMRELGSRRVMLPDGAWYWDLKPDFKWGEVVEL